MTIFILFEEQEYDYSTLPKDATIVTIFKYIKGTPNIQHIQTRLQEVLDASDPVNDRIIFNGPSYLSALAGYIWFTHSNRTKVNFLAYSVKDNKYVDHVEDLE